jgi:iron complex outermembrane recepter protein
MPLSFRRAMLACSSTLVIAAFAGSDARAQGANPNVLPEIVVTQSPIVTRRSTAAPGDAGQPQNLSDLLDQSFSAVTTMTTEQIERERGGALGNGGSLGNLLFDKPGITGSTFSPGSSRPVVRGLDNFRVRVQENGTSTLDVSEIGEDHAVPVDTMSADRVEVVRGPATLRYGSQAIGGVVSIDNNRIPTPSTPFGFSGRIGSAFTSVDRGGEGSVAFDGRGQDGAMHLDAFARRSGDYRIPGGVQANSSVSAEGGAVGGSTFFNGGFFGVALTNTRSLYHIPGTESAANNTRIDLEQTKLLGKGEFRPDSAVVDAVRLWFGATDYRHFEKGIGEDGFDGTQATFRNREQEARVETQLQPVATPFGVWTAAPGIQFNHQKLATEGEAGSLIAPSETTAGAFYLFNELRVSPTLKLQAAGRVDRAHVDGTAATFPADLDGLSGAPVEFGAKRDFTPLSASVGALQALPYGLVAGVSAQYVERAPRALELFAKGPHDASGTFEIGDPTLKKEAATGIEASLRKPQGSWRFDATIFHTRYHNFIFRQETGLFCDDDFESCGTGGGTELRQVVFAQRDARFWGAELATQVDLTQLGEFTFGVDGQYDFVDARFTDGSFVPRIPPHRLGGGAYLKSTEWFARVGLLHAFAQNNLALNETPTAGYNLLKAELIYTLKVAPNLFNVKEARFGVVGTNLLDDDVRNHVSFRKDEVLLPGRSVRFFASAKF